ncbi:MAG: carbonic anhydrase family protein [Rhodocyclaceae bacterium]
MLARSALALLLLCSLPAWSADWLTVASDRLRRVELDRASVLKAEKGTKVAWGRIVLSDAQAKLAGYRAVHALNRYDCAARTFTIVKREFFGDDDNMLREESIDNSRPISIKAGTADDRFFSEVCQTGEKDSAAKDEAKAPRNEAPPRQKEALRPPTVKALTQMATEAERRIAAVQRAEAGAAENDTKARPQRAALPLNPDEPPAPARGAPARKAVNEIPPPDTFAYPRRAAPRPAPKAMAASATANTAASTPAIPSGPREWSYSGEDGPQQWAGLSSDYARCGNGQRQSPIDLRDGIKVDQQPIAFDYRPSYFRITDTGRTIQVDYGPGSTIKTMGRTYTLTSIQFHQPSEERIEGRSFDMSAHLIHRDQQGHVAVVAVLLQEGPANDALQTLWNNLPLERNDAYQPDSPIDANRLLPEQRGYFSYMGSITTPPCTEGVLWLVLKQPVDVSREQIDIFGRFYRGNVRPIQPTAGRIIKESR